ncbi:MAG: hypothetical protein WC409_01065 [Candidatus Omnitrophota bacterium]|jgi:hypothetical protein|nr:hypothetical protein [Candidatus Omnitrophota bacterium]MDD5138455.1 hypothetical protein [Candidatus Omnitrophota bacterium]MDD5537999.1 hypothetical protein [Candidatus Omnitrophota bacterium]
MDCPNSERNTSACPCDYNHCPRKGACCECVAYHRKDKQLPACLREQE